MSESSENSREPRNRQPPKGYLNSPALISLVERNPCIWNPSRADYHNSNARTKAWESISMRFLDTSGKMPLHILFSLSPYKGFYASFQTVSSAEECKAKWETIKSAKNTWKRRHPEPLSGAAAPKTSKSYKYAKQMSFLESVVVKDNRISALSDHESTDNSDCESIYSEVTQTKTGIENENENNNAMDYTIKLEEEDHESRMDFLKRVASTVSPLKPMNRVNIQKF